jgi:hypothetical protein
MLHPVFQENGAWMNVWSEFAFGTKLYGAVNIISYIDYIELDKFRM